MISEGMTPGALCTQLMLCLEVCTHMALSV